MSGSAPLIAAKMGKAVDRFAASGAGQHRLRKEAVAEIGIHCAQHAILRPSPSFGQGALTVRSTSSQAMSGRRRRTWHQSCAVWLSRSIWPSRFSTACPDVNMSTGNLPSQHSFAVHCEGGSKSRTPELADDVEDASIIGLLAYRSAEF